MWHWPWVLHFWARDQYLRYQPRFRSPRQCRGDQTDRPVGCPDYQTSPESGRARLGRYGSHPLRSGLATAAGGRTSPSERSWPRPGTSHWQWPAAIAEMKLSSGETPPQQSGCRGRGQPKRRLPSRHVPWLLLRAPDLLKVDERGDLERVLGAEAAGRTAWWRGGEASCRPPPRRPLRPP
jgi:hypothetical protein